MNPNHLTPNVRKQVVEAVVALKQMMREKNAKGGEKVFNDDKEVADFFTPFYEKVKADLDNSFEAFMELLVLEHKYGFVSGYMGGANLSPNEDTIIEIK